MKDKQMSMDEVIDLMNSHSEEFIIFVLMPAEEGDSCGEEN